MTRLFFYMDDNNPINVTQIRDQNVQKRQVLSWYRRPSVLIGIAISILSVVLLAYLVNVRDLIAHLEGADLRFVALGLVFVVIGCYLRAARWKAILGEDV